MFPVAKCETCFSGDMRGVGGGRHFFKIQDKGFLALGFPAAAAVDMGEMGLFFYLFLVFKEKKDTHIRLCNPESLKQKTKQKKFSPRKISN